ncbi:MULTISPECIES: DUF6630 family protein [Pseudoalteromonas]|uniref:DUF6630 family protein n=1 Tax=Pseudoalteromonas TaxID=53246 RepID=UPI0002D96F79|nr:MULTISPECIES: hypothetical protein [Pseudoalteromonas]MCF6143893.1 hypothetical protein [Pseudoalteromonas mariniglutinosa NCIMB 1770]
MIKKIFKSLKFKSTYSTDKNVETFTETPVETNPLIELAKVLSDNDPEVHERVSLYINDNNKYFIDNEEELSERCIESGTELTSEVVLINELRCRNYIAYIDHSEEADRTIKYLDSLSGNVLSANKGFDDLISAYSSAGLHNAIGNFLYNSKIGPMPYEFLKKSGYSLANIDEGSDALALILIKNNITNCVIELSGSSNLKLKVLG